jgi:divalent metal cation (Fe/Co/Zn/Cd) transporter
MIDKNNEKKNIALSSVAAAIFLTGFKLAVGLATGSLGILSEALHSALDLVAAIIPFLPSGSQINLRMKITITGMVKLKIFPR